MSLSLLIYGSPGLFTDNLLLNNIPNTFAAYSVRKINKFYGGPCFRVRRSSDNTEANIGFTANNNLDIAALLSFVGNSNGFITTWFDQANNQINATQSISTNQPQIVSEGALIVNAKGLPTVRFNGSNTTMGTRLLSSSGFTQLSTISVHAPSQPAIPDIGHGALWELRSTFENRLVAQGFLTALLTGETWAVGRSTPDNSRFGSSLTTWLANQTLISEFYNTGKSVYYNNVLQSNNLSFSYSVSHDYAPQANFLNNQFSIRLGSLLNNNYYFGTLSEVIFVNDHLLGQRNSLYTDINSYYA